MAVGKLAERFEISRPAISQHLRVLKDARLVKDEAHGTQRVYRLDPRGFETLRAYFDRFWGDALQAFKTKVEER
jgi:DNA-binding transcriptional ArsR family regulator